MPPGQSVDRKIGDFDVSCVDEAKREAEGMKPSYPSWPASIASKMSGSAGRDRVPPPAQCAHPRLLARCRT